MEEYISPSAALALSRRTGKKRVTHYYRDLPKFLAGNGLSIQEFFELIGTPLTWPDQRTKDFASSLACICNDEDLALLDRTSALLLPRIWSRDIWGYTPSDRVHAWLKYCLAPSERLSVRREFEHLSPDFFAHATRSRIETESLLPIINALGMPVRWTMCLPDDACVMTSDPTRERILENYQRLSGKARETLDLMIGGMCHE